MSEKRIYDTPIYSELTAMPAVPPTGFWKIYPKAAGWYILDDLGTETLLGTGGSGHIISDEGTPLPAQPILNFVGAGVTVTDGTGETIVTISSGGTTISGLTENYLTKANATGDNIVDSIIYCDGTNVGIGTATPTKKLHIVDGSGLGGFRLEDGTEGSGKVLTSNATGVGTWQFAPGGANTLSITTITAGNYSVLSTDQYIGKTDVNGGGDTITLPTIASTIGQLFYFADESGLLSDIDANVITAQVGEFVDGVASVRMTAPYGSVILFNNGTFWKIFN
jgi:hypothetical protein